MIDHHEIIRTLLAMIIAYKHQNNPSQHLDLGGLAKRLKDVTGEEFSEFYLKKTVGQCIAECHYEDMVELFQIDIT